jgi:hypothetical protein
LQAVEFKFVPYEFGYNEQLIAAEPLVLFSLGLTLVLLESPSVPLDVLFVVV